MPGPNGPSRMTVGGTTSKPPARDTAYAATSRPASVPAGKSQSGRSPATGLYPQFPAGAVLRPCGLIVQYSVAFEAAVSRPSISSRPAASRSRAACSGSSRLDLAEPAWVGSAMADAVTVLPGAHVSFCVQRLVAQRAGRAAGRYNAQCPLGEGTRGTGSDPHP